jgi:hypothetical protein
MARAEYLNDPNAPKANSIVVAVTAFVVDDQHRVRPALLSHLRTTAGRLSLMSPRETRLALIRTPFLRFIGAHE